MYVFGQQSDEPHKVIGNILKLWNRRLKSLKEETELLKSGTHFTRMAITWDPDCRNSGLNDYAEICEKIGRIRQKQFVLNQVDTLRGELKKIRSQRQHCVSFCDVGTAEDMPGYVPVDYIRREVSGYTSDETDNDPESLKTGPFVAETVLEQWRKEAP